MKLWRKLAMKNGKGTGRAIKYRMWMEEQAFKSSARSYPLLDALFKRAGMTYALSNKQQETLRGMIEKIAKEKTEKESTNETN